MESHLGLMLDQIWDSNMYPLIIQMKARLRAYFFDTQWGLLIVK